MRRFYYNWASLFALLFLLAYSFFSFMGMLYIFDGAIWKALIITVLIIAIIIGCVFAMTMAKISRFRGRRIIGQIGFGAVMLGTFLIAAVPFTSFINAWQQKDDIKKCIENTQSSAIGLKYAYSKYVDKRVADYKNYLQSETSTNETTELLIQSLQRHLAPPSLDTIQNERENWIYSLNGMSIWNIMLPANLKRIETCVDEWILEYIKLSDKSFIGPNFQLFECDDFNNAMKELVAKLKETRLSVWAFLAALICFAMMLLPYWRAEAVPIPQKIHTLDNIYINEDEIPIV